MHREIIPLYNLDLSFVLRSYPLGNASFELLFSRKLKKFVCAPRTTEVRLEFRG